LPHSARWRPLPEVRSNPEPPTDPIPTCDVTVDGQRVTLRPHAVADTVADLAVACDLAPGAGLWIDGAPVAATTPLIGSGLRVGSAVTGSAATTDCTTGARVEVAVIAGPSCEGWRPLGPGRHCIGRSPTAELHLDDAAVEFHHAVIDVGPDGSIVFRQLTGRIASRLDGVPCEATQVVQAGQSLQVGSSRLTFRSVELRQDLAPGSGSIVDADRDPWRRVVHRGPSPALCDGSTVIAVPDRPRDHRAPPLIGLVGAGVAVAGAGLMAAVLGQVMFAFFAVIGAVASFATWAVGAIGVRRGRRRAAALHRRQVEQFVVALRAAHSGADRRHREAHRPIVDTAATTDVAEWERRVWNRRADRLSATLGLGTVRWGASIGGEERHGLEPELLVEIDRCEQLTDVAVPIDLPAGHVVGVHGDLDAATALARGLVVQLATTHGPADWQLLIVTTRTDEWSWADWLPHVMPESSIVVDVDRVGDVVADDRKLTLVVTDAPAHLSTRTGPLRRLLDMTRAACIVVAPPSTTVPAVCDRVLELGVDGLGHWRDVDTLGEPHVHLAGISRSTAERAARRLAPLIDPEDLVERSSGVPRLVRLSDLVRTDAGDIARRWTSTGPDPDVRAAIGCSPDGVVDIDLVRDGPHGLIAGTTGAGKSELLRTLVVALAAEVSPDHLSFVLIDFKGGATFDICARLPHTVGVVTDLDEGLAERALVSLDAEIRRRERLLRAVCADDLTVYRRNATDALARLVVVVDEFATLANELPDFLTSLVGIAQRGRSLGVHLLLATQRPAGVVTDDIRANTNLRLALRVHDRSDALDVVGDERPATFPRSVPGRAALRLGPDELVVFQTASCAGPVGSPATRLVVERPNELRVDSAAPTELEAVVDSIREAAAIAGIAEAHRPWLDPLPDVLDRPVGSSSIGLIDDPARQARRPLRWERGNLLLVGAIGSGTTSTAIALAGSRLRAGDDVHLYVIDGRGDVTLDALGDVAQCGGVIRVTEAELIDRLLRRLTDELDRRSVTREPRPEVVVIVDGLESVRTALSTIERSETAARLDRVLHEGPSLGIVTCATTDGTSSTVLATTPGARWVLHLDAATARAAGLRSAPPPAIPGRLRVVDSGLSAQVAFGPDPLAGLPRRSDGSGPPTVEVLPAQVDPDELAACPDGLVVGIASEDLLTAALHVPAGDHVFIGGAAGTGKSIALRQLSWAWAQLNPTGTIVRAERCRPLDPSVLDACADPGTPPVLVTVDDADRVDDVAGHFAAIVAGRRPGVTIIAAARLEAVRVGYGHWVRQVTRSRCGLIMTSVGEVDGELLGATLPRRSVIPPRPGLGWLIDARGHRLVQVAARMPA
jgi:DNA segregation ATPase FtsK/SpoIIIE, S-DNA-T family